MKKISLKLGLITAINLIYICNAQLYAEVTDNAFQILDSANKSVYMAWSGPVIYPSTHTWKCDSSSSTYSGGQCNITVQQGNATYPWYDKNKLEGVSWCTKGKYCLQQCSIPEGQALEASYGEAKWTFKGCTPQLHSWSGDNFN